jgi:type VI secretion system secreted protein Hcp
MADNYVKIEGAGGEATAKGFEGTIEVLSASIGGSAPTSQGPGTTGLSASRVTLSSFNFMSYYDKSTPLLFQKMCDGSHIPQVTLSCRKQTGSAQEAFLIYTFFDCLIDSQQVSMSSGGDDKPTVSTSIAFGKVEIEYKKQNKDGKLETAGQASWDVLAVSSK